MSERTFAGAAESIRMISHVTILVTFCSSAGSSTERFGGDEGRPGQHESSVHNPASISTRAGRDGDDERIAQGEIYGLFTPIIAITKAIRGLPKLRNRQEIPSLLTYVRRLRYLLLKLKNTCVRRPFILWIPLSREWREHEVCFLFVIFEGLCLFDRKQLRIDLLWSTPTPTMTPNPNGFSGTTS